MKTVYLCGPISGCTDSEAKDWRELAKKSLNCKVLDPMRRDYRGFEDDEVIRNEIVTFDKVDVSDSNILLVNFLNYDKPSIGTSMEIQYAWERGKLILTVANPEEVLSPWLRYHSHYIFDSLAEAFVHINENK